MGNRDPNPYIVATYRGRVRDCQAILIAFFSLHWMIAARRVKALDPGMAPAEVKQALGDYTASLVGSLEAMKAGRETTQYDTAMADAKQRLADCFRRYR
jgi:hypothetical protein